MCGAVLQADKRILYTDCGFIFLCHPGIYCIHLIASLREWTGRWQQDINGCSNPALLQTAPHATRATKKTAVLLSRLSVVLIHIKLYGFWQSLTTRRAGFRQIIASCFVSDALFRGKIRIPNYSTTDLSKPNGYCVYLHVKHYKILRSAHERVFICFVWISEETAIISLYSINWLVFITEKVCVYCAVRTERLNMI